MGESSIEHSGDFFRVDRQRIALLISYRQVDMAQEHIIRVMVSNPIREIFWKLNILEWILVPFMPINWTT